MSRSTLDSKAAAGPLAAAVLFFALCFPATTVAAQNRCADVPVDVTSASEEEHRFTCSTAKVALQMLGRCSISVRKPLQVHIIREVRRPFGGPIFGLFDIMHERVLVTQYANVASLIEGTAYSELPPVEFYGSLIVHEVVHGVLHQNYVRQPKSHAAYEYPAYALQIEFLPSSVRDKFLQSFDQIAIKANTVFNDTILFFDPFFFAARAYQHFRSSPDGCAQIRALLEGDVDFVAAP